MTTLTVLAIAAQLAAPQTLAVRHNHDPGGGCTGTLTIGVEGIEFQAGSGDHGRAWPWTEVQTVDILSPTRLSVLTYQDVAIKLGRDRPFDFEVTSGRVAPEAVATISEILEKPITNRLRSYLTGDYEVAVKHLHRVGGCEGRLRFGPDWVSYETDHAEDLRIWRKGRDLAAVWSTHPFELQLQVYERDANPGTTRMFRFVLKEALDSDYYDKLRRELIPVR